MSCTTSGTIPAPTYGAARARRVRDAATRCGAGASGDTAEDFVTDFLCAGYIELVVPGQFAVTEDGLRVSAVLAHCTDREVEHADVLVARTGARIASADVPGWIRSNGRAA